MAEDNVYLVSKHGLDGHQVYARDGSGGTVLPHDRLTGDQAAFLAAHMNHAFRCGVTAGDKQRAAAICEALGLA